TEPGGYFITINCHQRRKLFGELRGERVELNSMGQIAHDYRHEIPSHFQTVSLDAFIVMPSHVHGILFIGERFEKNVRARYTSPAGELPNGVGAQHAAPVRPMNLGVKPGSLGAIVRSYKAAVTRVVNLRRNSPGEPIWHRNYYGRVIRNDQELEAVRNYITFKLS
ncbi:MAG: transposase, partial [Anaerolineales bacterium]